jgi:methyl-accepting chemotaxis protein
MLKQKSAQIFRMELSREISGLGLTDQAELKSLLPAQNSRNVSYFLVAPNGEVLMGAPQNELTQKQFKQMLANPNGSFLTARSDAIVVYDSLPDGLRVGKIYRADTLKSEFRYFQNLALGLLALLSLICVVFALLGSSEIFAPLKAMVAEAKLLAQRDFRDRPFPVSNDEMNELSRSFLLMRSNIKSHVQNQNTLLRKIEEEVPKLDTTIQVLSQFSREQARGSAEQASSLEQVHSTITKLAMTAKQLLLKSGEIEQAAAKTLDAFSSGKQILFDAIESVQNAQSQVNKILEFTKEMENHSRRIKEIVEIIEEIAVQSKLLAFNALVESSAAGEAGKRFSVVANQMQRLSAMTREFNTNIGAIVQDVLASVESIAQATARGRELMDQSARLVNQAGNSFQGFSSLIDLSVTAAQEVADSMEFQVSTSEEMTTALSKLKSIARDLAAGTAELERSSAELLKMAQELKILTSKASD